MSSVGHRLACLVTLATLALVAFVPFATFTALGCTSLDGLTGGGGRVDKADAANDDDGTCNDVDMMTAHDHCGACGTKCGASEHCLDGACAPGCPDHAVFVSADGNDNADGCTQKTPKRTIGSAIALLKALGAQKHEVRVCRGQYTESVTLDYAANISGGFECSTWTRSERYGAPSFDPTNAAIVAPPSNTPALVVTSVTDVVVDGLTLRAANAGANRSVAALMQGAASVTLSNDVVIGGGGSADVSPVSVGVLVDDGATVTVKSSRIDGGSATNAGSGGYGSAAIYATKKAAALAVVESSLVGGSGAVSGGTGSSAILAFGGRLSVQKSVIHGGTGKTGTGSASFGIIATGGKLDVDVVDNVIDGGNGKCTGDCSSTGARIATTGTIRFAGNRVTGGEVDAVGNDAGFTGVSLGEFATADVQNNEVFSGNTKNKLTRGVVALEVQRGDALLLAHNTLGVGPSSVSTGSALVVDTKAATIVNNLFFHVGVGSSVASAARLSSCNAKKVVAFRHNAWVGFPENKPLLAIDILSPTNITCSQGGASANAVTNAEAAIDNAFAAGVALGNVRLAATCAGDPGCRVAPACSSGASCASAVFGAWDNASAGGLLGAGWKLTEGAPCAVARASGSFGTLAETDAWGAARTEPRSLGAHESDGACQP